MSRPQPVATPQTEGEYTDALCDHVLRRHRAQRDNHYRAMWRAVCLAPTLEVCEALLRGEHVPRSCLDPEWAARFRV